MAKNKYGIFDKNDRKIVGILHISENSFSVDINGEVIDLVKYLSSFDNCDITINVGEQEEY